MQITLPDWLPTNRRDFLYIIAGAGLALGLMAVPGLTLEPSHCTDCKTALAACQAELTNVSEDEQTCWRLYGEQKDRCFPMSPLEP